MSDLLRDNKAMLPWLFPLALLLIVVAVALAPSPVVAAVAVVVLLAFGYLAVPLYYLRYRQRHDRDDIPR
jgi:positive regulator of sigma E activity